MKAASWKYIEQLRENLFLLTLGEKYWKKIGKNWNLNSWNLSQIILCSLRERSCFNSYYNYPCKYLIISTTKIYFQNFEKRKWTIWSNNFFQPRQLITKANQVGVRDQRIKLVKQLKDIYARYIVTICAFMYSSINLWTRSLKSPHQILKNSPMFSTPVGNDLRETSCTRFSRSFEYHYKQSSLIHYFSVFNRFWKLSK